MSKSILLSLCVFTFCGRSFAQQVNVKKIDSLFALLGTKNEISYADKVDALWMEEMHSQLQIQIDFENSMETLDSVMSGQIKLKDSFAFQPTTEELKKQLEELNQRVPIVVQYNKSLENLIRYFLQNRRSFYRRLMNLSKFYFPMFEEMLDRYELPQELKYLAVIESALNPRAKSVVGAAGLWQFMYGTALIYKLKVGSYEDERYDPIKSTEAACKYLKALYRIFDDWSLALAAYNTGPGNVSKAIRRSGGSKNFWEIRRLMPRETSSYFPIFLATMYIFEYAEQFDLQQTQRQYHYAETDTVFVKRTINFEQISRIVGVDSAQVVFLNPSYRMNVIPASEESPYPLRLPAKKVGFFLDNQPVIYSIVEEEKKPLPDPDPWQKLKTKGGMYVVRRGDSLWTIARKFPGVSANDLKRWNSHVIRGSSIQPGMRIRVCGKC